MDRIQVKLTAVADIQLKAGQEIDAAITVSEQGFFTSEISKNLVMVAYALPDPFGKPTGYYALLGQDKR